MPIMPLLLAGLLPLLVAFGATGLVGRARRRGTAPVLGGIGIALGFLAAFAALGRGIPFLTDMADHQVAEVAMASLAAGLLIGLTGRGLWVGLLATGVLAALWCLGGAGLEADPVLALVAGAAALATMARLALLEREGVVPVALIAIAAGGLAGVSMVTRGGLAGDLAWALAAACCGWMAWGRRWRAGGAAALLPAGAILVALAATLARTALHPPWGEALLPLVFWADRVAARIPAVARRTRRKAARRRLLFLGAAVTAGAAVLVSLVVALTPA